MRRHRFYERCRSATPTTHDEVPPTLDVVLTLTWMSPLLVCVTAERRLNEGRVTAEDSA